MSDYPSREKPPGPIVHLAQSRRSAEEDRAWAQLYASIRQSPAAEEVVKHLDADPQSKRDHLALYICAKVTLRQRRMRKARIERLGSFIRLGLALLGHPVRLVASEFALIRDVAFASMPSAYKEPAMARARALKGDPAFASSSEAFGSTANAPAAMATSAGPSRKAA